MALKFCSSQAVFEMVTFSLYFSEDFKLKKCTKILFQSNGKWVTNFTIAQNGAAVFLNRAKLKLRSGIQFHCFLVLRQNLLNKTRLVKKYILKVCLANHAFYGVDEFMELHWETAQLTDWKLRWEQNRRMNGNWTNVCLNVELLTNVNI